MTEQREPTPLPGREERGGGSSPATPPHPNPLLERGWGTHPTALDGIRVIENAEALAGPYCAMYLGDLGAEVIKVERRETGDQTRGWAPPYIGGESAYFLGTNRNKRSITLDFTTPAGGEIMRRLIDGADVFITNIPRLSSMKKYGLDPESCLARNPRLIHCAVTGFGHSGPYAGRPGYDILIQGMSGTMALTGEPDDPPIRFPTALADMTGGVYALIGILAALFVRERTGRGQAIDVGLLDAQIGWLTNIAPNYFATGKRPPRLGNAHPNIMPYQPFRARDKWFIVAVGTERLWQRFCGVLGITDTLMNDPRFATNPARLQHRQQLVTLLEPIFLQRDADEWVRALETAEVPAGPINHVDETLNDPHVLARHMIVELEHPLAGLVKSLGFPVQLSATPASYRRPPPSLGQHTEEILRDLGYDAAQIARLREERVV